MALNTLTKTKIKSKLDPGKYFDGGGLYIEVLKSGGKSWRFKYRFSGKEKRYVIGSYPTFSLEDAREKRTELKRMIAEGIDPAVEKKIQKSKTLKDTETTFKTVAEDWFKRQKKNWSEVHYTKSYRAFERDIYHYLGDLPISQIVPMTVKACLSPVEARGAIETAHRLRQHISGVFRLSVALGMRHDDPAALLVEALEKKDRVKPMPAITDESEVKDIINHPSLFNLSPQVRLLHYVLAYTLVRVGGVLPAKWEEIDFKKKTWTIPRKRMKVKSITHDFVTPLPKPLLDKLREWKDFTKAEPDHFIFESRQSKSGHLGREGIEKAYRETLKLREKHTPHGWRAAFNTIAQEHGWDQATIDRQLDHVVQNEVERAYNRAKKFKQRSEILDWWADILTSKHATTSTEKRN